MCLYQMNSYLIFIFIMLKPMRLFLKFVMRNRTTNGDRSVFWLPVVGIAALR